MQYDDDKKALNVAIKNLSMNPGILRVLEIPDAHIHCWHHINEVLWYRISSKWTQDKILAFFSNKETLRMKTRESLVSWQQNAATFFIIFIEQIVLGWITAGWRFFSRSPFWKLSQFLSIKWNHIKNALSSVEFGACTVSFIMSYIRAIRHDRSWNTLNI